MFRRLQFVCPSPFFRTADSCKSLHVSHNSFAAQPPLMPDPTTIASYVFFACALVLTFVVSCGMLGIFVNGS